VCFLYLKSSHINKFQVLKKIKKGNKYHNSLLKHREDFIATGLSSNGDHVCPSSKAFESSVVVTVANLLKTESQLMYKVSDITVHVFDHSVHLSNF